MDKFNIDSALNEINKEISNLKFDRKPKELYEPITYFLSLGGKKIRPLLCLNSCHLFSNDYFKAIKPSIAIELFHNFSLIHDDIMDNAPLRRGKQTVHEKWNNNVAILSGDVTLIEAYDLLEHIDEDIRFEIFKKFNHTARQVCEGQQIDMNFEKENVVSIQDYSEMITLKTAVLFGFSLYTGARIGNANISEAKKLYQVGVHLGIIFQIIDDYLDAFGDQKTIGKLIGGDIIAGKKTFLLVSAFDYASDSVKEELIQILNDQMASNDVKIAKVLKIYQDLDIKSKTKSFIELHLSQALKILQDVNCSEPNKLQFQNYFMSLIDRDN